MELDKVKTPIADLKPGMYVSSLDRPWLETPFPFQGFIVSEQDIHELLKYCLYVYVDIEKSHNNPGRGALRNTVPTSQKPLFDPKQTRQYSCTSTRDDELKNARKTHHDLTHAYDQLIEDIAKNRKLRIPLLRQAVIPMVDSVIRNPDAFLLLTRLKKMDAYAYQHAMSCAVLAVATGRQIGLPRHMLLDLALGAALFDIGRARVPHELLTRPRRLDDAEMQLIRQHVQFSLEAAHNSENISPEVIHMIETHHERHDGSGYPARLAGEEIPLFGRIAGLVDCYDAITSNRPYAPQVTPDEAIRLFYEWRDVEFQGALVEQFIQVIGVYPVGTIVELSDGRIGIVSAQHQEARLRPMVMMILERNEQPVLDYFELDLRKHHEGEDGKPLSIVRSLPSGSHGIDPVNYFVIPE